MSITAAERMRQLIDEVEAEMSGQTVPSQPTVLPDGKRILSEVVLKKDLTIEPKDRTQYHVSIYGF